MFGIDPVCVFSRRGPNDFFAPKGHKISAQGNALGSQIAGEFKP
jgi:hypothetical protein